MRKYVIVGLLVVLTLGGGFVVWNQQRSSENERWQQATEFYKKGDYENAKEKLNGLQQPTSQERLRIYGQTMLATRDLDKALSAYQDLYEKTKDPQAQLVLGNIYNEKKEYDQAIRVYKEAIAANPHNTQAYVNLATLYNMQNNAAEARRIVAEGITNNPGSVTLHELQVSLFLRDRDSAEFKSAVEALKKLNPESALLKSLNA